jgi:hypothetical protein
MEADLMPITMNITIRTLYLWLWIINFVFFVTFEYLNSIFDTRKLLDKLCNFLAVSII